MLNFLPAFVIGLFSFAFYTINTVFWLIPIIIFSFLKALLPFIKWRKIFSYLLDRMASNWVVMNTINQKLFTKTEFEISGLEELEKKQWYLVISNHQTWVDIVVLQRILRGKIPFLKFFLKKELIYVPFLGLAWWALDFPFMKRYSQGFIKKNPHLKGKDLETTQKACAKFKYKPVSIMNFIEGTRFTEEKFAQQKSPFKHLLKPKAGGVGFVLSSMGSQLNKILDVTIYYPDKKPNFIDFLCGNIKKVYVDIDVKDIDHSLIGDYVNDRAHKIQLQKWVNQLWLEKDEKLEKFDQASK